MDLDPVQGPELDGPRVHHLRAPPRHLGHLRGEYDGYAPRPGNYARVGGVDAVHVGEDLAPLRPSAAASATAVVSDPPRPSVMMSPRALTPWKPATMATWPSSSKPAQAVGLYPRDDPRAVAPRDLHPCLRAGQRGGGDAPVVQGHREERDGLELARRE